MQGLIKALKERFGRGESGYGARTSRPKSPMHRGLRVEALEERRLLTVTVTVDELTEGPGTSLWDAINEANLNPTTPYVIDFSDTLDLSADIDITLTAELGIFNNQRSA